MRAVLDVYVLDLAGDDVGIRYWMCSRKSYLGPTKMKLETEALRFQLQQHHCATTRLLDAKAHLTAAGSPAGHCISGGAPTALRLLVHATASQPPPPTFRRPLGTNDKVAELDGQPSTLQRLGATAQAASRRWLG